MGEEDRHLVRFFVRNGLAGVFVGWSVLAALLYLDVARLGELMFDSDAWLTALVLAGSGFGVTFGSLAMGTAVFLLPTSDGPAPLRARPAPALERDRSRAASGGTRRPGARCGEVAVARRVPPSRPLG